MTNDSNGPRSLYFIVIEWLLRLRLWFNALLLRLFPKRPVLIDTQLQHPEGMIPFPDDVATATREWGRGQLESRFASETGFCEPLRHMFNVSDLVTDIPEEYELRARLVPELDRYLSPKVLELSKRLVEHTYVQRERDGKTEVGFMYTVAKPVPLDDDGNIDGSYLRRWAAMLNDIAARGWWSAGTMLGAAATLVSLPWRRLRVDELDSLLENPEPGSKGPRQGILFSAPFVFSKDLPEWGPPADPNNWSINVMNRVLGYDLFQLEGAYGDDDWSRFPWKDPGQVFGASAPSDLVPVESVATFVRDDVNHRNVCVSYEERYVASRAPEAPATT